MFEPLAIPGPLVVHPTKHEDVRGYFIETFSEAVFHKAGLPSFVQDNESLSCPAGTVRGLHFQVEPFAQAKLVRCTQGSVFDVAVDIRRGSPTFGKHVTLTLSGGDGLLLFLPVGFAHGFCTLESDTVVQYKVSAPYSARHEAGLAWDDPALGIAWPVAPANAVLSDRDRRWPQLAELPAVFAQTYASSRP
jgi:dTDP-4-dehydrorhamnose 3,5-epimerase